MNALSSLREKLSRSKKYRESFAASVVKRMIPLQIRVLRKQRDWSQARLATESKLTQGVISRAEDPDYGNLTVNTLVRVGAGFDCAFIGRFVPFSELARWYANLANEKALEVPSFDDEPALAEPWKPKETSAAPTTVGTLEMLMRGTSATYTHRRWIRLSEAIQGDYQSGPYGQLLESRVTTPDVASASSIRKPPMQELTGSLTQMASTGGAASLGH